MMLNDYLVVPPTAFFSMTRMALALTLRADVAFASPATTAQTAELSPALWVSARI